MRTQANDSPVVKMLSQMVIYAAEDIMKKIPSACPKNEREEAKRTAKEFLNTKFYESICDILNVSHERIRDEVLRLESTVHSKELIDELP
jgi:hypothetical protein